MSDWFGLSQLTSKSTPLEGRAALSLNSNVKLMHIFSVERPESFFCVL